MARKLRLQAALRSMAALAPSREPACLQALQVLMTGASSLPMEELVGAIQKEGLVEEAEERLRCLQSDAEHRRRGRELAERLAPLAADAQRRRAARWQLDTRRTLIRFTYVKEGEALDYDDGDLHTLFLHAFRLEGLGLALDLGKRPRPLLSTGLPLSAGIGSRGETMDAVLKREPAEDPTGLMARLNLRLPGGLRIEQWAPLPGYATAVSDLARLSHWHWEVAADLRARLEAGVAAFLQAATWLWERGPGKFPEPLDLRALVAEMTWDGTGLCFTTGMGAHLAINPLKVLGAIFGLEPSAITGLVRTGVDLDPDPRLGQADRFEPKLKNMYEDAVLLGGGSNIVLVDEDDDEPIRLG
ncbi:MAG: DUF2344 domain-containing protein [Holophagaceae bacterium]